MSDRVLDRHEIRVTTFSPDRWDAFMRLHSVENGAGWCRCVAWWVPTWEGWGDRSTAENAELRRSLCARGEYDGLLALVENEPVGWCQVGPRDRLAKLVTQLGLEQDDTVWAVSCFFVAPRWRHVGVATALLDAAVTAARAAGATRLEGYPRSDGVLDDGEAWTGPEALFVARGFDRTVAGAPRSVYAMRFD